ncbi:MAG: hypothetical protein PHY56_07525 [Candidatus Omnitrophica bacterium]|jgi:hypothetical protein|nr:hypothetical protein [Candidatus Omnitrophota bacterium]
MGGPNSGRKSVKGIAINLVLEVQAMLNDLLNEWLGGPMTRDELKAKVEEIWDKSKVVQEELQRLK